MKSSQPASFPAKPYPAAANGIALTPTDKWLLFIARWSARKAHQRRLRPVRRCQKVQADRLISNAYIQAGENVTTGTFTFCYAQHPDDFHPAHLPLRFNLRQHRLPARVPWKLVGDGIAIRNGY